MLVTDRVQSVEYAFLWVIVVSHCSNFTRTQTQTWTQNYFQDFYLKSYSFASHRIFF